MAVDGGPESEECADISFFRLEPPHCEQWTVIVSLKTRISATWPQSAHKKSNSGMPSSLSRNDWAAFAPAMR